MTVVGRASSNALTLDIKTLFCSCYTNFDFSPSGEAVYFKHILQGAVLPLKITLYIYPSRSRFASQITLYISFKKPICLSNYFIYILQEADLPLKLLYIYPSRSRLASQITLHISFKKPTCLSNYFIYILQEADLPLKLLYIYILQEADLPLKLLYIYILPEADLPLKLLYIYPSRSRLASQITLYISFKKPSCLSNYFIYILQGAVLPLKLLSILMWCIVPSRQ